jgi:hypothetical protein
MSKNVGWIKLSRKFADHWLYNTGEPYTQREAWLDILLSVNYEKKKAFISNKAIICHEGQVLFSLRSWSKKWRWSTSKVRRFFEKLVEDDMIKIEGLNDTTRLTVLNWQQYQGNSTKHLNDTESDDYEEGRNEGDTLNDTPSDQKSEHLNDTESTTCENSETKATHKAAHKSATTKEERKKEEVFLRKFLKENFQERIQSFKNEVFAFENKYDKQILNEFFNHYSAAISVGSVKMLFEKLRYGKNTAFDTAARLRTWQSKSKQFKKEREVRSSFSEVNEPASARINDRTLEGNIADKYNKYLSWVASKYPALARSNCKILSKDEFFDLQTDRTWKARKQRVSDSQLVQIFEKSHIELNEKGYERNKFGSSFEHIKSLIKNEFESRYA